MDQPCGQGRVPSLLEEADREGQGQAMAQLFPTCGEEAGGGRQPGFPCDAETVTFHFHPTTTMGKAAPSGTGHRRTAGQGTRCPAMARGTSGMMWDSMEGALVVLCVLLLCCSPPLAGCHQGRWKTQRSGVRLGNGVKGWRKGLDPEVAVLELCCDLGLVLSFWVCWVLAFSTLVFIPWASPPEWAQPSPSLWLCSG